LTFIRKPLRCYIEGVFVCIIGQMYTKPFKITDNAGNNSFSFSKRKNPAITIPSVINGTIDDLKTGNSVAFEDFDENGNLKTCVGLKNFIRTIHPTTKKPVIIVDNHNHVFYFWHEARNKRLIKDGATLVHIDKHKDTRKPETFLTKEESRDMKKVFEYTNYVLNVGNYLPPAIEDGLIGNIISITSESEIKNTSHGARITAHDIIVNIDLDFWAPEMDYIDNKLKNDVTRKLMGKADLITIATSPFFIDQELAIKILYELLG
jgi:hypothetical protein